MEAIYYSAKDKAYLAAKRELYGNSLKTPALLFPRSKQGREKFKTI